MMTYLKNILYFVMWDARTLSKILKKLSSVETTLSNLDDSVNELKTAIAELAARFPSDELAQQLADLQAKFDALQGVDAADKQEITDLLADADENVGVISDLTGQVKALGVTVTGPTDPGDGDPAGPTA
jgi:predicted  nucleic acid-binding Zn-ribbon protein